MSVSVSLGKWWATCDEIESDRSDVNWRGRSLVEKSKKEIPLMCKEVDNFKMHKNLQSQFVHVKISLRRFCLVLPAFC